MAATQDRINQTTEKILGCAFKVSTVLGCGFLEKVYHNALVHELRKNGFQVAPKKPIKIFYDGIQVGDYEADILVDESVLIELKAVRELDEVHQAQCMNYLRATKLSICLLLNFGKPRLQIKRIVLDF